MKINITNKQYRELIIMSGIANAVLGILGDGIEEPDYKSQSKETEKLEEYLLQFANDFGCNDLVEDFEGKKVLKEKFFDKLIMAVLDDYDEIELFDGLANKLAWRDFRKDHTETEIQKMGGKTGYLGPQLYNYEKKYWDEFENHDYNRLEIKGI